MSKVKTRTDSCYQTPTNIKIFQNFHTNVPPQTPLCTGHTHMGRVSITLATYCIIMVPHLMAHIFTQERKGTTN